MIEDPKHEISASFSDAFDKLSTQFFREDAQPRFGGYNMAQPAVAVVGADRSVQWAWTYTQLGASDDPWTRVLPQNLVDEISAQMKDGKAISSDWKAPVEDFHGRNEKDGVTFSDTVVDHSGIVFQQPMHSRAKL